MQDVSWLGVGGARVHTKNKVQTRWLAGSHAVLASPTAGRAGRNGPAGAGAEPADMLTGFQDPKADVSVDGVCLWQMAPPSAAADKCERV